MTINTSFIKNTTTKVSQARADLYNRWINIYGMDVKLHAIFNTKQLTVFGETSLYAKRTTSILRIVPAFNIDYAVMPFGKPGLVDEQDADKQLYAYIRTIDNINVGDFLEVVQEFAPGTMDRKYYKVDVVKIEAPSYIPVSKKIIMSTYSLPIELEEEINTNK